MLLATRRRVDGAAVEDQDSPLSVVQDVCENVNNLPVEMGQVVVLIVQVICLWQVHCAVENRLRGLGNALLALSDFIVQISGCRLL